MTGAPLGKVLSKLGPVRKNGSGYMATCPSHDDATASLSLSEGDDGRVLLCCQAGCESDDILARLELTWTELFPAKEKASNGTKIAATYDYVDENGAVLFQVCRMVPKDFRQRRPNGNNRWTWKLGDVRRVPYKLPEVLTAVAHGEWVLIVEGEKDVHTLNRLGFIATTNAGGAAKWPAEFAAYFKGGRVAVIPDNDEPGAKHADKIAASLKGIAAEVVRFAPLSKLEHGDVTDWVAEIGDEAAAAELRRLLDPGTNVPGSTPPTSTCPLADALEATVAFVDRFMALSDEQLDSVALWAAMTHTVDHFDVVAYLYVTSAEKRSGKTLLLDILEQLVCRGRSTTNISPAALYRMIDEQHPTLLIDEADTIFPAKGRSADPAKSDLVGLINAGFRRGRPAYRMGGANMRELEEFDPFGPKALAGIGRCLPDTTEDRSIPIVIPRKGRGIRKERYRLRVHEAEAKQVGAHLADAIGAHDLRDRWPALPAELNDRQQDIWEPLLTIADAAGGDWPDRARRAAVALHADADPTETLGVKLLADIRTVFTVDKLVTKQLVSLLNDLDESPWCGWRSDKGMSSVQLVNMLKPFGIKSKAVRAGDDRGRGFELDQFADTFARYLDDDTVDTVDGETNPQVEPVNTKEVASVDASVDSAEQAKRGDVNTVNAVTDIEANVELLPDGQRDTCRVCATDCMTVDALGPVHPNCAYEAAAP